MGNVFGCLGGSDKSYEKFLNIKDGILSGGIVYELES